MPIVIIVQLVALAVVIVIAACVLYQTVKMRDAYIEQRKEFARVNSFIQDFQRSYAEVVSLLQQFDSVLQESNGRIASPEEQAAQSIPEAARNPRNDLALMRKGILSQDPNLRFGVLKDWLGNNSLAILRRAAQEWRTPDDLIAMIPSVLEPVAEVIDDRVLLVGTRGYSEKFEIAIRT
jgi:hypothetical protein